MFVSDDVIFVTGASAVVRVGSAMFHIGTNTEGCIAL